MSSAPESERKPRTRLRSLLLSARLPLLLVFHLFIFGCVLWTAFLMRFTLDVPEKQVDLFYRALPAIVVTKVLVFYWLRSFNGWWRYVHFSDVVSLVKSSAVASLAIITIDYFLIEGQVPRIVLLNDFAMGVVVLGGLRSTWRVWDERIVPLRKRQVGRALMVGRSFESSRLAHLINGQRSLDVRVVGLIDPLEVRKSQRHYGDIPVVGTLKAKDLRGLLDVASNAQFKIKILPKLEDQLKGLDKVPIREVSYNDLLRRDWRRRLNRL